MTSSATFSSKYFELENNAEKTKRVGFLVGAVVKSERPTNNNVAVTYSFNEKKQFNLITIKMWW